MEKSWTVIQFTTENAVVPTSWLLGGDKCYWPPFSKEELLTTMTTRKHEEPNTCWPFYDIVVFRNSTYGNSHL